MSPARPQPSPNEAARQAAYDGGPQRLSPWFGLTGLLLLATLLAAAFVQARQYTLLNMTVQYQDDYLVLSLQQMETEYLRLREQLRRDAVPADTAALQLRYDVFVSRVSLLGSDRARRLLASSTDNSTTMRDVDRFIRQADLYLGGQPQVAISPQAANALLQALEALDSPIHQLMLDASHRVAEQVTERQAQVRNHNQIGLALTGFLVAMVVLFAVITLRQVRALELRRHRLSRLADELRDARIDAEAASDAKSEFLADMSHELRTPLHGLLGMLSLIKDAPRDPRAADWLLTADESAQHLRRLLDDILDLSKLDAGSLTLAPTAVALMDLLREVRSLLQPTAVAKGLTLLVELDPLLPPLALLDGTRVRQVLFNLVTNAIKYSEAGVVTLQCQRLAPGGAGTLPGAQGLAPGGQGQAMIEFSVSDTGIGMDRDTVARLFRRHNRAEDVRAWRQSGTGLGLAISRNLARLMGGEIQVRSMLEAGSVFSFHCPLHPVTEAPLPSRAVPAAGGLSAGLSSGLVTGLSAQTARPLQVLVAEDHPVNRLYLAALLARLGHQVKLVDNGLEAVRAMQAGLGGTDTNNAPAQAAPFDLVLMDVHMPVMDGVMATQAIRQLPGPAGQVCVVAITADVFDDTRARCLDAGVAEVATKPLSLDALRALLVRRFGDAAGMPTAPLPLATEAGIHTNTDTGEHSRGLLDRDTVHSVCDLMGSDKAPSLYGGFFTQAEDAARRMRVAMRDADPEALRRSAHTVKGAALNLGLPALADAASLLSREAGTLAAAQLALAVQRFEEVTQATRALCAGEGLLR